MVMRGGPNKKGKSPPILSQEFIIQNHGDIVSCACMFVMLGLMFQTTQPLAQIFIAAQYNVTHEVDGKVDAINYSFGWKDLCTACFYTLCWIVAHAIVQEYILDKFNKRLHLSKTKHSKFNDSGNMLPFYILSIGVAVDQVQKLELFQNFSKLWEDYPVQQMSFMVKFYFILQIAYWLHCFPELYFMKTRREEVQEKVVTYTLYLIFIVGCYVCSGTHIGLILLAIHYIPEAVFNMARIIHCAGKTEIYQHAFLLWAVTFVLARIATISITIVIVWFGLGRHDISKIDMASGNFNTQSFRIAWVSAIILVQAWMAWIFIRYQVRRYRESTPGKKQQKSAKKEKKVDGAIPNGSSPRAKAAKEKKQD
jgi:translocating chain-associated membrane protein 1